MTAKEILATVYQGIRIAIRSWIAMRRGKRYANKGVNVFRNTRHQHGLSDDVVEILASTYETNLEFLSFRGLSRFAFQTARQSSNS